MASTIKTAVHAATHTPTKTTAKAASRTTRSPAGSAPEPVDKRPPALVWPYPDPPAKLDPALQVLVRQIIDRVADKWTMLALEVLAEHGRLRFTRVGELIGDISQKMLTKTLRQMEADGLILRTVYPVIPPRVEYELTALGLSLGAAFCGVWIWAETHRDEIEQARQDFAQRAADAAEG